LINNFNWINIFNSKLTLYNLKERNLGTYLYPQQVAGVSLPDHHHHQQRDQQDLQDLLDRLRLQPGLQAPSFLRAPNSNQEKRKIKFKGF
jgi:hypothetical protein